MRYTRNIAPVGAILFGCVSFVALGGCGGGGGGATKKSTTAPITTLPPNPTKVLRVVATTQPASPLSVDQAFQITVEIRDQNNALSAVSSDTSVAITTTSSTGLSPRVVAGVIRTGSASAIISGLRCANAGSFNLDVRAGTLTAKMPLEVRERAFGNVVGAEIRLDEGGPGLATLADPAAVDSYASFAFVDRRTQGTSATGHVYVRSTSDSGATFTPVTRVDRGADTANCFSPAVDVDGKGVVAVAWADTRTLPDGTVHVNVSSDGGKTFNATDVRVDGGVTRTFTVGGVQVAVVNSTIHVVFSDERVITEGDGLYYVRSTDGGKTFSPEVRLDDHVAPVGAGKDPWFATRGTVRIVGAGNDVHVQWYEAQLAAVAAQSVRRLSVASSRDGGLTFSKPVVHTLPTAIVNDPQLLVSGGIVHSIWRDNRTGTNMAVYARRSLDGGATWQPEVSVPLGGPKAALFDMRAAASGNTVAVSFEARNTTPAGLTTQSFLIRSGNGGASFTPTAGEFVKRTTVGNIYVPSVTICGQRVLVTWAETTYANGQRSNVSTDAGATFPASDLRIDKATVTTGTADFSRAAVQSAGMNYVFWRERRGATGAPLFQFLTTVR